MDEPLTFDLNVPVCPREVIHCDVADMIRSAYMDVGMTDDIPPVLGIYISRLIPGRGYDWQERVVKSLIEKGDVALAERWVNEGLPAGLWRAELRGWIRGKLG